MELILKDGYYVDHNGNKWNTRLYTELQAKECSDSLVNCKYCKYCIDCKDCKELRLSVNAYNLVYNL